MNVKQLSIVAASLALGAGAANAGGYTPPVVEPVVAPIIEEPIADWAGGYAGVTLGYGFGGDDRVGVTDNATDELLGNIGNSDGDGAMGGIRIGYRWQRDKWVFGPELGFDVTDFKGETNGTVAGLDFEAESKIKNVLALRFKTGYLVQPDLMVYGIAGWARADVDYDLSVTGTDASTDGFKKDGYILGLGVEKLINDRMSITGEYEYADFGKETVGNDFYSTEATMKMNAVKIGVNWNF